MRREEHFRVDASLMQQLGESLISDDIQCLIELIKNAYDADAQNVKIIIDAPNRITIEDDGHGMDEETIVRGWLTISNSLKLEQKRLGRASPQHKRIPLGDKGLGRLSTQRLGSRLKIESIIPNSTECLSVAIDWADFVAGKDLSRIAVEFDVEPAGNRRTGTRLEVSGLLRPNDWSLMRPETLRERLVTVVSPYEGIANFRVQAFLNGTEVSPSLIAQNVRSGAAQTYRLTFDGDVLGVSGLLKSNTLRVNTKKARDDYSRYFQSDGGEKFLDFLLANKITASLGMKRSDREGYLIAFQAARSLDDIGPTREYLSPGAFEGEIDSFSLDAVSLEDRLESTSVLDSSAEMKKLIKGLSGIRVYRDGFLVRTAHDWLGLGEAQTSGGSFYGLRPFNTMGYIALSAKSNASLRETTNRQGFIEDSHYESFKMILDSAIELINRILEHLRRTWNAFVKKQSQVESGLRSTDPRAIHRTIEESFARIEEASNTLERASVKMAASTARRDLNLFPPDVSSVELLDEAQELMQRASEILKDVSRRSSLSGLLVTEIDALSSRLTEVYELVSLGITAEAFSHDIALTIGRLSTETRTIKDHSKTVNLSDVKILRFIELVRTTIGAMEKQLAHLDPALRYAREKREVLSVVSLVRDASSYYRERLHGQKIKLNVNEKGDFRIQMNRGKLIQVLDNLVLNSEYWVKSAIRTGLSGEINISIAKPSIVIDDSGPGIEALYEESLFDPFVTAKPKGEGRGLGLFIATQLLEVDGCYLRLLPERNSKDRRFRLQIDLSGVVQSG